MMLVFVGVIEMQHKIKPKNINNPKNLKGGIENGKTSNKNSKREKF